MKTYRIALLLPLYAFFFYCAGWSSAHAAGPQIITLPGGQQIRFAGITYKDDNTPPSMMANVLESLPTNIVNDLGPHAQQLTGRSMSHQKFDSPRLLVWFKPTGSNVVPLLRPSFLARLADQNGVVSGVDGHLFVSSGLDWYYVEFPVLPRRGSEIQCLLYPTRAGNSSGNGRIPPVPLGKVTFANALSSHHPQWQPESLPVTKQARDITVRLDKFDTGFHSMDRPPVLADGNQGLSYEPAPVGPGVDTYFDIMLKASNGDAWVTQAAELSDATGNQLVSSGQTSSSKAWQSSPMTFLGEYRFNLRGTLWPDEAVWKLKLWVKRKTNLPQNEYVTFKNVPVPPPGATNFSPISLTNNGVQVVLTQFVPNAAFTGGSIVGTGLPPPTKIRLEAPENRDDVALDFVSMTADTGTSIEPQTSEWDPQGRTMAFGLIPANVQTVDITWTVQKLRTVEFLVAPPRPATASTNRGGVSAERR